MSLVLLLATGLAALAYFRVGPAPQLRIDAQRPGIGPRTGVRIEAREPVRGLSSLRVELRQGDGEAGGVLLAERTYRPRPFWAFWGGRTVEDALEVEVGRELQPDLQPGEARLWVQAGRASTWLRRPPPVVDELRLPVSFTPPQVEVTSSGVTLAQGGSAAVAYRVTPTPVRDGVQVGDAWFPGAPLPNDDGERFALFGAPHDLADGSGIRLVVEGPFGNQARVDFLRTYQQRPPASDTIRVDDRFLERVVPAIHRSVPNLPPADSLLAGYLAINRDLRRENARQLRELAARSVPELLWRGAFLQLPNSRAMAGFAERRTYLYGDREVDQQVHLGFDLASVRHAPVPAANHGAVLFADYLGIYGNTVVLDHGFGLLTLYAHLSAIDVGVGQTVRRGEPLGKTGQTGLAGGDHLHYSVLVHGLMVQPVEWWDPSWVANRVTKPLGLGP